MTMPDPERGTDRAGRRAKRFLSPSQKYEIFLQLVRQQVTMAEAAEAWQVDRAMLLRIRTVAKEGALEALTKSRPGARSKERDVELEAARADPARLGDALTRWRSSSCSSRERVIGAERPGPGPSRRGHQGGPARPARRSH